MSQTVSAGVVGPSYWAYMAFIMAECLGEIAGAQCFEPADIPRGVYSDAQRFFHLILEVLGDGGPPRNLAESNNTFLMAAEVAKKSSYSAPTTGQELEDLLKGYASFLDGLSAPRDHLTQEEAALAKDLQAFFSHLHEWGAAERHVRSVRTPALPIQPILG